MAVLAKIDVRITYHLPSGVNIAMNCLGKAYSTTKIIFDGCSIPFVIQDSLGVLFSYTSRDMFNIRTLDLKKVGCPHAINENFDFDLVLIVKDTPFAVDINAKPDRK